VTAVISAALSIGGFLLRCKACLAVLAAIGLVLAGGIYGVTVEKARSEARIERMKKAADEAAGERDAEISKKLEDKYDPVISRLKADKAALEQKVKDHANQKAAKPVAKCVSGKLGDAAGLLRPRQSR
jgi:hypothetical protein